MAGRKGAGRCQDSQAQLMGRAFVSGLGMLRYSDVPGYSIRTFSCRPYPVELWLAGGLRCLQSHLPQGLTQCYRLDQKDRAVEELEGIYHVAGIIITPKKISQRAENLMG